MSIMQPLIKERKEQIISTFNYLHLHPEVSWKEVDTTRYVVDRMAKLGLETSTFPDQTGAIAIWRGTGEGPTVGLRTDLDALYQEVDGTLRANHSCGHDAHMTMVIESIEALKLSGFQPKGTLKILFQPAEEKGNGALSFIEKGVVDDVDHLIGIHLRPIQELPGGKAAPAIIHGATTMIKGSIYGKPAHGARPHLGINAIEVASLMIQSMQAIRVNPSVSHSAKVTSLHAGGESYNIIPDRADFAIDVRAQSNEVMEELLAQLEKVCIAVSQSMGAKIDWKIMAKMAAGDPHPFMIEVARNAITKALGEQGLAPVCVTPGGEDFHFYTVHRPNIKSTMIGLGCNLTPGLHDPYMKFDRESMLDGISVICGMIKSLMK
jgi:amidohydrolase